MQKQSNRIAGDKDGFSRDERGRFVNGTRGGPGRGKSIPDRILAVENGILKSAEAAGIATDGRDKYDVIGDWIATLGDKEIAKFYCRLLPTQTQSQIDLHADGRLSWSEIAGELGDSAG